MRDSIRMPKVSGLRSTSAVFGISIALSLVLAIAYYILRSQRWDSSPLDDLVAFVAVCVLALPLCFTLRRVHRSRRITVIAACGAALVILPSTFSLLYSTVLGFLEGVPYLRVYVANRQQVNNASLMGGILLFFVAFYLSMLETGKAKKRLEEQMLEARRSDEAYRSLVENSLQALVIIQDLRFVFVNSVFEHMSGYSASELLDMSSGQVQELVHPEDRDMIMERAARRLAGEDEPARYEFRMLCKDGSIKWLEAFTALIEFGGKPAIQQAGIDITTRKHAEEALRNSEQKYRTMAENISDIVWTMDMKSRFTYVSPSVEHILGYSIEDILHINPASVLVPEALERLVSLTQEAAVRVADGGDPWVTRIPEELPHYHKDGRVIMCEISAMIVQDAGAPTGIIGVTRDVTERRRIEEAVRASEEKYRTMAESISDMVWMLDTDGRVTYCNPASEKLLGYTTGEITGADMRSFLTQPAYERAQAGILDSIDTHARGIADTHPPREYDHVHKDGTIIPCEVVSRLLTDEHGRPTGLVGVSRDVRERKRAEAEKHRLELQVQQAQKFESLGILAGGLAHDFNNILVGILGNADLAMEELPVRSPVRVYLHQINLSAKRLADLVRQMLAYSGKGKFVVEQLDLNGLVLEMTQLLEASLPKNVQFGLKLSQDLPAIEGDATQVRQIFMNLATNAAESLDGRPGPVIVATRVQELAEGEIQHSYLEQDVPPGRYVCMEIQDTGCGMNEETQRRMFDPFFSTKFTGRGLGLSAVLGIVRGHQGAIVVESAPGKGTALRVYFPALDLPAHATQKKQSATPERAGWRGTGKVLVVDDEPAVLAVAQHILEHLGFEVLVAENGPQAIETLRDNADSVRMVLLDVAMPEMGGEETFAALREIRPDVPVLLSSGYSEDRAKAGFASDDLAGFVQKPYTAHTIARVIRDHLA